MSKLYDNVVSSLHCALDKCLFTLFGLFFCLARQMGSHNRMQVVPSRFEWERWKNDVVCMFSSVYFSVLLL